MKYDARGINASEKYPLLKPGWYPFQIVRAVEGESQKTGDYQVVVDTTCLDPRYKDFRVRHWVTFLPKEKPGAGMALHFLKCIGEPHEDLFDINPLNWERKRFMGEVEISEYNGKKNNKFTEIAPMPGQINKELPPLEDPPLQEPPMDTSSASEEIPF